MWRVLGWWFGVLVSSPPVLWSFVVLFLFVILFVCFLPFFGGGVGGFLWGFIWECCFGFAFFVQLDWWCSVLLTFHLWDSLASGFQRCCLSNAKPQGVGALCLSPESCSGSSGSCQLQTKQTVRIWFLFEKTTSLSALLFWAVIAEGLGWEQCKLLQEGKHPATLQPFPRTETLASTAWQQSKHKQGPEHSFNF